MFFEEDERYLNPDFLHAVHRELYAINSSIDMPQYGIKYVPTHTEDGIPIRKLYVSNLPPKTTRTELFGVFAQYGFIKSCWLRMGDKGPNKTPTPTYAFVTFSSPADAHKALQAPTHEKSLRGRNLRISPADSWHQPAEDANGHVRWKPRGQRQEGNTAATGSEEDLGAAMGEELPECEPENEPTTSAAEPPTVEDKSSEQNYTILNVLNTDCLKHILDYVPLRDLIRSERVSKTWQNMVRDYIQTIRTFKTSWWQHVPVVMTTAVLRRMLQRTGGALLRLHIDHRWSALNDRTAHIVGKFCPNLEELKVVGMHIKNWNPLIYGCKQLKHLDFISCNKLTDSSLVHLVKSESSLESLTIENNTHITGLFLTGSNPQKLNSLAFYNCYSLQGTVLSAAIDNLPGLTTLKLDVCPATMWKIIPLILNKLPRLQVLSLSEVTTVEMCYSQHVNDDFCDSFNNLPELRVLNLSKNVYMTNAIMRRVAKCCPKLEELNVSSCNARRSFPFPGMDYTETAGIGDEGIQAICRGCRQLSRLDVSYLAGLTDEGLRAVARLPRLNYLVVQGIRDVTAAPLLECLASCNSLVEIDACGCDSVADDVIVGAVQAIEQHPRHIALWLAGTAAAREVGPGSADWPVQLRVDTQEDRSNPHLRPDFVDAIYDDESDDSFDDLYGHDMDDFLGADDDMFLDDDDLDDYAGVIQFGIHPPDILLL